MQAVQGVKRHQNLIRQLDELLHFHSGHFHIRYCVFDALHRHYLDSLPLVVSAFELLQVDSLHQRQLQLGQDCLTWLRCESTFRRPFECQLQSQGGPSEGEADKRRDETRRAWEHVT